MLATVDDLLPMRRLWKQAGLRMVMVAGNFDLFHEGHVWFLRQASTHGDRLVVQLASDAVVQVCKGAGRPIFPFDARVEIVGAIRYVDVVVKQDNLDGRALVRLARPDAFVRGQDYNEETAPETSVMQEIGGEMIFATTPKHSSRDIITRIKEG